MPMLPQQWHNSLAQVSLAPPVIAPEHYEELWWYSGGTIYSTSSTSGSFIVKGGSAVNALSSATKLYTLNASWSSATKFALEISLKPANGATGYAALWDMTSGSGSIVSGSTVSVVGDGSTAYVVRSGQFTLISGHVYGVTLWGSSGTTYATDASLIIFS